MTAAVQMPLDADEPSPLAWRRERVVEDDGARFTDHVSACGRYRIEAGHGAPWALHERGARGAMRWAVDVPNLAAGKRAAKERAAG